MGNGTKRFGSASYRLGGLRALLTYRNKPMTVVIDNATYELPKAQQVVVANCQYFGGGMQMAPSASPTDGVFDVILIKNAGKIETMRGMNDIVSGKHLDQANSHYELVYGKRISVAAAALMRIGIDGVGVGPLPASVGIQPRAPPVFPPPVRPA